MPTACPKCNRSYMAPDGYRSGAVVRDRLLCLPCAEGASVAVEFEVATKKVRQRRAK